MLNFEEELKKFKPNPEIDEADDEIYHRDLSDVMDIIQDLMSKQKKN